MINYKPYSGLKYFEMSDLGLVNFEGDKNTRRGFELC